MAIFPTPLRYPGGKSKLFPYVEQVFEKNGLLDGHYVEPYAGGAGLAMSLLLNGYARYVHLNDLDRSIFSVWHSIVYNTEEMCRFVQDVKIDLDEWHKQKDIQYKKEAVDLLELGKSTLFLNRTNRSGVLSGGVIGGFAQNGKYKIDVRFNKKTLIQQIKKIAFYQSRITITNLDAKDFLLNDICELTGPCLVNLDPPYYIQGRNLYKNAYQHKDHAEISAIVPKLRQYWMVTYDNVDPIRELYASFALLEFKINYSLNRKYKGKEILIADPRLQLPSKDILAKIA